MQPEFVDAAAMRWSLPHGHLAAIPGMLRSRGIARIVDLAAPQSPLIDPGSKLACARALSPEPASSRLGEILGLGPMDGKEMLAMLDWLSERRPRIVRSLADRYLKNDSSLILCDSTTTWIQRLTPTGFSLSGEHCPTDC
ncbi:MAG: hypothetical protein OXI87_12850 [Albidovulum sp.]|nr:hypothetical protein [Albidovulum sp.]MDE0305747.1 hypothetical protein [Albidovulum sp.]